MRKILDRVQPDLLNTHFLTGYGYWGDFSGFHPNILTVWGDDVYVTPHENPLKGWLARRALRHAEFVTGDSADILSACVGLGTSPQRCYEVLWGVDFQAFRPDRPQEVRQRLGIGGDDVVLFSPRSFTQPYYNIDVIIRAVKEVVDRRSDVHVVFAGYEGDQRPFQQQARDAGLTERTHFVGRIPHAEFGAYLAACDVFISVPSVDATAVSLLEAMSCARAIVVSDLPSSTEWITDGESGRVVKARDARALARVLMELTHDPALRTLLGAGALAVARRYAGFDQNMARVGALVDACLEDFCNPPEDLPHLLRNGEV